MRLSLRNSYMSTTTFRLPQELVDHVIDHLYNDYETLRACSRVAQAWLPTSRYHLFAKVCLQAWTGHGVTQFPSGRCKELLSVIESAPEIAGYIRELEICEGAPMHIRHPELQSATWVTSEPALLSIFKRLKNLRHLEISSASIFYWRTLPAAFQNALCSLLATSSSLTYLKLHSWCFPNYTSLAVLLSHCKNLKGLSLSSTTVEDDDLAEHRLGCVIEEWDGCDVIPSSKLEVLTLDHVTFGYLDYWLFGETPMVDVSSLRELRVSHFSDLHVIEKLLLAVSGSLEHLHLKPGQWRVRPLDLSHSTCLRSVRLTLEEADTALEWAIELLCCIKSSASCIIERVALEFFIDPNKLDGWEHLQSLLSESEFSSLKQVEIGLFASPTRAGFIRAETQLAGLKDRAELRLYHLGLKSQRSKRQLSPRISRYEN
ncbi:hypothetical protein CC1G_02316 [Coprinopsis cinerea okayama7|uniref:F-box domain-containing protein n=1 Tax=Coprinopsis cinerea (strain Okayama-7 / 130 / ATCC MYA-4618 / FGSC 9003) TaxID=240176 RepID=A8N7Q9_COPC7|nr:hypothetical protein CC1G_02316 [Coprinopsis cinerea okayama7\|eukprot:XP_001830865.1 hypothetical protein CC1G_02316 [Coprinopsis cinerea okayama7\